MITIIKQGVSPQTYYAKCPNCQCEFTYDATDIKDCEWYSLTYHAGTTYVLCPWCNHQVSSAVKVSKKSYPMDTTPYYGGLENCTIQKWSDTSNEEEI